ncbi:uncharacterized protein LOC102674428 isoform X2 [Apis dorsata]|uniref:uncharacterized protein LOC102674428 isoform X2 n=1 Tax=Apis dorsata TaxID=7462 RepID=UPI0003DF7700|nr:uncharacterized protein LOC102674428 isoform X2 [Apis dorsata]
MSYLNGNQEGKYGQLAHKLIKLASMSNKKVVLRHDDQSSDVSTELLHEFGTTDVAIGDVTAEVMLTTMGKIPSEMYDLEDTSPPIITKLVHFEKTSPFARAIAVTEPYHPVTKEPTGHSSILIALLTALLIIFLLCCITACIITKSKRKSTFFGKEDMECEPGCTGMNQPLLDKISSSTNKTSCASMRN